MTAFTTPDLCDEFTQAIRVLAPLFNSYGGCKSFSGEVVTVKCFEDNSQVKALASTAGAGKIMVVDGGGSLRRALLGDIIAKNAVDNGWAGFVINGCIRDVDILATLPLGVKALNAIPMKTEKRGLGDVGCAVEFAGVVISPGQFLYSDNNGILISDVALI